jgi:hypothetical protein
MVDDLDNKLNVLFDHSSNLGLDEPRKINQCQLRSKSTFDFNTKNVFGKGPGLGSRLVIDFHQSCCLVHQRRKFLKIRDEFFESFDGSSFCKGPFIV